MSRAIVPICFVCKEPIPLNSLRKEYCSEECAKVGKSEKHNEYGREMRKINQEMGRCTYCGGERDGLQVVCSKCREQNRKYTLMRNKK